MRKIIKILPLILFLQTGIILGDEGGYNLSGQLYGAQSSGVQVSAGAVETAPLVASCTCWNLKLHI